MSARLCNPDSNWIPSPPSSALPSRPLPCHHYRCCSEIPAPRVCLSSLPSLLSTRSRHVLLIARHPSHRAGSVWRCYCCTAPTFAQSSSHRRHLQRLVVLLLKLRHRQPLPSACLACCALSEGWCCRAWSAANTTEIPSPWRAETILGKHHIHCFVFVLALVLYQTAEPIFMQASSS